MIPNADMAHSSGRNNSKKAAQYRAAAITDSEIVMIVMVIIMAMRDAHACCDRRTLSPRPQYRLRQRPRVPPQLRPRPRRHQRRSTSHPSSSRAPRLSAVKPAKTKLRKDIDISQLRLLSTLPSGRGTQSAARSHHRFIASYRARHLSSLDRSRYRSTPGFALKLLRRPSYRVHRRSVSPFL